VATAVAAISELVSALRVCALLCVQDGALQGLECFPVPIMRWTESFYMDVFRKHGDFKLQEHGEQLASAPWQNRAARCTAMRWQPAWHQCQ
jgi:hypothetical protein